MKKYYDVFTALPKIQTCRNKQSSMDMKLSNLYN